MLQEAMEHINNYFVPLAGELKTYTITDGVISPSFGAEEGDRFLICNSIRNDGVYTWHAEGIKNDDDNAAAGLHDETFAGTIRLCAIPPVVLRLIGEISQWVEANRKALNTPFASESFNGYSYSVKTGKNGGALTCWDTPAGKALERWRRPFI